jgi:hypothetical protein
MKKTLSALTVMFVLFLLSPSGVLAATLSLSPSSGSANRGCTFPVQIMLNTEGANSDGTDAILNYDPTRFSAQNTSIVTGSTYSQYPGVIVDNSKGEISISGVNLGQTFSGTGLFATVNFQVLPTAPTGATTITFDFDPNDKANPSDSNVATRTQDSVVDVLSSVVNGSYVVGTGQCGVIPRGDPGLSTPSASISATPKPIYTPPPELPQGGIEGPTLILTVAGLGLTVLGILGLALL